MTDDHGSSDNQPDQSGAFNARLAINYVLIAIVFFAAGFAINSFIDTEPPPPDAPVQVDAEQLRQILISALDERDQANADLADEESRFAMVDDDPYLGEEDAPIVIVEFSDFFCSFCKRHFDQTFTPLLENYGQYIRYVYRDFARLTPGSPGAAAAAQCAFEQGKFWEFHSSFFSNQSALNRDFYIATAVERELDHDRFVECLDEERYLDEVELDGFDGQIAGIMGTPGFFVNGQMLNGAQPYAIFERVIQRELEKAGIDYAVNAAEG